MACFVILIVTLNLNRMVRCRASGRGYATAADGRGEARMGKGVVGLRGLHDAPCTFRVLPSLSASIRVIRGNQVSADGLRASALAVEQARCPYSPAGGSAGTGSDAGEGRGASEGSGRP